MRKKVSTFIESFLQLATRYAFFFVSNSLPQLYLPKHSDILSSVYTLTIKYLTLLFYDRLLELYLPHMQCLPYAIVSHNVWTILFRGQMRYYPMYYKRISHLGTNLQSVIHWSTICGFSICKELSIPWKCLRSACRLFSLSLGKTTIILGLQ